MGNRSAETKSETATEAAEETKPETKPETKGVSASAVLAEIRELRARIESLEAFRMGEEPRYAATVTAPDVE